MIICMRRLFYLYVVLQYLDIHGCMVLIANMLMLHIYGLVRTLETVGLRWCVDYSISRTADSLWFVS